MDRSKNMKYMKTALLVALAVAVLVAGFVFRDEIRNALADKNSAVAVGHETPTAEATSSAPDHASKTTSDRLPKQVSEQIRDGRLSSYPARYWEPVGENNE